MNLRTGPDDGGQGASIGGTPIAWPHADAAARFGLPLALAAIALGALLIQLHLGAYTDPLWLMLLCDRLLDGQTAYVDFLENSPPFAILIYMPPVMAARVLGVAREPVLVAYVFVLVSASLLACVWLLARAGRLAQVGSAGALAVVASLLLLPDYQAFGQRDHIALILTLPWLTLVGLRAEGLQPSRFAALAAGLVAGTIFAIRPHYALSFASALAFVAWRQGIRSLLSFPEVSAAIASAALSVAASAVFFPNYLVRMLPIVANIYVPDQQGASRLLIQPASVAWLSLLAALVASRDRLLVSPLAAAAASASIGAFLVYLMQGKGNPYHCYVAVALLSFSLIALVGQRLTNPIAVILPALSFALVWLSDIEPGRVDLRWPVGTLVLAGSMSALTFSRIAMRAVSAPIRLGADCIAFASLGMASLSFHSGWHATPPLFDEVNRLGPHPRIAMIAPAGEFAHPLVSRVQGVWTQSVISLLITNDVGNALLRAPLDPSTRARLEQYRQLDRNTFLADVARTSPDAVIVDESWAYLPDFEDGSVKAWLSGYRADASVIATSAGGNTHLLRLYTPAAAAASSRQ